MSAFCRPRPRFKYFSMALNAKYFQLGIPMDTPLELINGGHGLKNPLALDVPRPETEKLPPVRYKI